MEKIAQRVHHYDYDHKELRRGAKGAFINSHLSNQKLRWQSAEEWIPLLNALQFTMGGHHRQNQNQKTRTSSSNGCCQEGPKSYLILCPSHSLPLQSVCLQKCFPPAPSGQQKRGNGDRERPRDKRERESRTKEREMAQDKEIHIDSNERGKWQEATVKHSRIY